MEWINQSTHGFFLKIVLWAPIKVPIWQWPGYWWREGVCAAALAPELMEFLGISQFGRARLHQIQLTHSIIAIVPNSGDVVSKIFQCYCLSGRSHSDHFRQGSETYWLPKTCWQQLTKLLLLKTWSKQQKWLQKWGSSTSAGGFVLLLLAP